MAVCGKEDHGRPRQSQVQPGTVRCGATQICDAVFSSEGALIVMMPYCRYTSTFSDFEHLCQYMGQFLQDGKNVRFMSLFFKNWIAGAAKPSDIDDFFQFAVTYHDFGIPLK